ncbi:MAG: D-2-hydroxyacid dehydrogenase family protein [Pseudomonadota bacterium]|nr:D-2-hydroxyacid dehydrogenase family protein [Pseudomonadota bacterium]
MSSSNKAVTVAVLDDYQGAALRLADWSVLDGRAVVTVFNDHLANTDAVVERLKGFDVLCVMRERTPLPKSTLERLPRLKLIVSTGARNAAIDVAAASERGVAVAFTGYTSAPTIEMTWALILAASRHVVAENLAFRRGGWQQGIGVGLAGKTLGVLGLGRVGGAVAEVGALFGMKVITWSPNMTPERAAERGARAVSKEELLRQSDVLTIHMVLSPKTRGLLGADELALMKTTSLLVNTSRGPLVDEAALVSALTSRRIGMAAIDVFDTEPLPADHPFRSLDNVLGTPHVGYVADDLYRTFYGDTVKAVDAWLAQRVKSA